MVCSVHLIQEGPNSINWALLELTLSLGGSTIVQILTAERMDENDDDPAGEVRPKRQRNEADWAKNKRKRMRAEGK